MEKLSLWIPLLILLHCLRASAIGNLNSDAQFLLEFAASIPHGPKLNWSAQVPVCSSWVGVTCTPDGGRVQSLRLPGVGMIGQIPADTLGELDALEILSLHSNRLALELPSDVPSIPSLSSLFLQRNELSGALPSSLSSNLTFLDLSCNSFTGEIPPAVLNLTQLAALYLENNSLSGLIPRLRLPKLKHLNLSYNNLTGSIPESLQSFPVESFLGNPFLCGTPLPQCSAKRSFWKTPSTGIIIIVAGGGSCLLLALVTAALICISRRKSRKRSSSTSKGNGGAASRSIDKLEEYSSSVQEAEKNKLVFFQGCSYNFDLEDLLRASAEVLGKGSHGTTYKAVLEDGVEVVVKRLKEVAAGKREFEQQMEIIGSIGKHPNVVQLRSYYYSKDEKLLVFDYAPLGNLSTFLHGRDGAGRTVLDWRARVEISLGVARGIAHIHAQAGGRFIHGNIKSSNVLLITQELNPCVSEFGFAPLLSPSTTARSRAAGYRAPEVVEHRRSTQKSDVYSLGVLLLELLTGKAPLGRSPGRDDAAVDLPRWVQSVVREEWTAEVFDAELVKCPGIEDDLVRMLQIAMQCVARNASQRPQMEDVVGMLEDLRGPDSEPLPSSEKPQG
ncbi:probable inactive receptor kinase At5g58300 [Zingiber officinale]|uniref:Protein kinase domain-containing protein n=1 Tax=Zingiber officinale TaxID=94328 RepID=A0A8J5FMI4_ZINOF|nr:probable inactive receptor kinase At5g58300 [Zingiber officinale]KAG6490028.1 hypothetical protein ZIOFF_051310 [Zingiber officinale]